MQIFLPDTPLEEVPVRGAGIKIMTVSGAGVATRPFAQRQHPMFARGVNSLS